MRSDPDGDRGMAPFTRLHGWSADELTRKLSDANRWQLAGVLVEDSMGLENLDAILATPDLDLVYLGIYDISQTLGLAGQVDHPLVLDTVASAVDRINAAGKAAGAVARDADHLRWLLKRRAFGTSLICATRH